VLALIGRAPDGRFYGHPCFRCMPSRAET